AVFVKLWTGRERLNLTGSLEGYLKRAVFNTALNHIEQRDLKLRHMEGINNVRTALPRTPEAELQYSELEESVKAAVNDLPNRTRSIFVLIRSEEMSYKEVAEELQISTKAVEKEMMRALRLLREALKEYLFHK